MKIIVRKAAVLFALLGNALAFGQTSPDAALDALHNAGAEANQAAFIALLADDVVFLGVDDGARLQGESVRDFVSESFSRGDGWAYRSSDRDVQLSADGAVAWFDESLVHDELGRGRGTGVLMRDGQSWKLVQYNLTISLPYDGARASSGFFGSQATSPAAPPSPECRQARHKTNKKGGC